MLKEHGSQKEWHAAAFPIRSTAAAPQDDTHVDCSDELRDSLVSNKFDIPRILIYLQDSAAQKLDGG